MMTRRPVGPADRYAFRFVSDPQMRPDGARIAYVVTKRDLEQNRSHSTIWVMHTGAPDTARASVRLAESTNGSVSAPRWSPDGTRLAFLSDHGDERQICVIDGEGADGRCLETELRPESAPVWSPDGSLIAFTARVFSKPEGWVPYPGAPAGDGAPGVKVITRLKFRLDGFGYLGDKRSQIFVIAADGSAPARQITWGDFDHYDPSWAPAGDAIICSALREHDADDKQDHLRDPADIWRFDLTTGAATMVYRTGGPAHGPQIAPDGRYLAFTSHLGRYKGSTNLLHLMLVRLENGRASGRAVSLTASLDRSIGPAGSSDVRGVSPDQSAYGEWAPDSTGLYCLIADRGESHLWFLPVHGAPAKLTYGQDQTVVDFSLAPDGQVALQVGNNVSADDLWLRAPTGALRQLTDLNPIVRDLDIVAPERFTYQGADSWPIEAWLIKPLGYKPGGRYPLVLSVHGGPHSAYGTGLMLQFQALAAAGFAVLYANPRGSTTYGQAFQAAVVRDWGGKDFVDLMAGVDAVIGMGIANPNRLGITGWSYGGYMSAWTITQTDRFRAAVIGAPVINRASFIGTSDIPWWMEWQAGGNPWTPQGEEALLSRSPIRYVERVVTPALIACGEEDLRCPISEAEQFYIALKRLGRAPAVHIRYPEEMHGLTEPQHTLDYQERMQAWFHYYLMT